MRASARPTRRCRCAPPPLTAAPMASIHSSTDSMPVLCVLCEAPVCPYTRPEVKFPPAKTLTVRSGRRPLASQRWRGAAARAAARRTAGSGPAATGRWRATGPPGGRKRTAAEAAGSAALTACPSPRRGRGPRRRATAMRAHNLTTSWLAARSRCCRQRAVSSATGSCYAPWL